MDLMTCSYCGIDLPPTRQLCPKCRVPRTRPVLPPAAPKAPNPARAAREQGDDRTAQPDNTAQRDVTEIARSPRQQPGIWTCGQCDYTNEGGSHRCSSCEAARDAVDAAEEPLYEVTLGFPWGRTTLRRGERLSVGREDSPLVAHMSDYLNVSRQHAIVELADRLTVTDLDSTNGTSVNGRLTQPRTPTAIGPGDVVGFGRDLRMTVSR